MPVIIDEFEIVTAPATKAEAPPPAPAAQPPQVIPEDIGRIVEHLDQRFARIWAD